MIRKCAVLTIFILILAVSLQAGDYSIVYQEQIEGAEQFTDLDPILSEEKELVGFLYVDSAGKRIIVDSLPISGGIEIPFENCPMAAVQRFNDAGDSLYIYVIHGWRGWLQGPYLSLLTLAPDTLITDTREPEVESWWYFESFLKNDLKFIYSDSKPVRLIFESVMEYYDYMFTLGPSGGKKSTAAVYSLDLDSTTLYTASAELEYILFPGDSIGRYARFTNYHDWWDYRDGPDDPDWGDIFGTTLTIFQTDTVLAGRTTLYGNSLTLLAGDVQGNRNCHEVFYHGSAIDLLDTHGDPTWHIACYSLETGAPEELWYHGTSHRGTMFDYIYERHIYGVHAGNEVMIMDGATGIMVDSIELGRSVIASRFYETESGLQFVCRSYDTIFVYQFDTPTGIDDRPEPELPTTFSLRQNYPNPFNPETAIEFELPHRCQAVLKVYNILGQEIATLLDRDLPAGVHSTAWEGANHASGIYLYRLQAGNHSETKKMVLLK